MGNEKTPSVDRKQTIINNLHNEFAHTLLGYALYVTHDVNEAHEATANTFKKICELSDMKLETINSLSIHQRYGYLSKTLLNIYIDSKRKKDNQKRTEKHYMERRGVQLQQSPEAKMIMQEKVFAIKKSYKDILSKETQEVQDAFYLRTELGMKNKEIADRFNKSPNTIGTQFRRLRIKILKHIEKEYNQPSC